MVLGCIKGFFSHFHNFWGPLNWKSSIFATLESRCWRCKLVSKLRIHDHLYLKVLLFYSGMPYHVYFLFLTKLKKDIDCPCFDFGTVRFEVQRKHAFKSKNNPNLHLLPNV